MYIEDNGGTDGDIKVIADGEEYTAEANYDLDDDGIDETAIAATDDGYIAFSDTDGDGEADLMTQLDEDGDVVGQAKYDSTTGEWVSMDSGSGGFDDGDDRSRDTMGGSGESMVVETEDGMLEVGPATEDLNDDGVADTAVVRDKDGDVVLFTDVDGDGDADMATEITSEGEVTIARHTGDGDWEVVERGHIDEDGSYTRDALVDDRTDDAAWAEEEKSSGVSSGGSVSSGLATIDPATGQWK